jgi:hypothetical protein
MNDPVGSPRETPYFPQIPDSERNEIAEAICHVIESGPLSSVTMRIPVWRDGTIIAWYNVQINREPHTPF